LAVVSKHIQESLSEQPHEKGWSTEDKISTPTLFIAFPPKALSSLASLEKLSVGHGLK
jgi:hypothetical protein